MGSWVLLEVVRQGDFMLQVEREEETHLFHVLHQIVCQPQAEHSLFDEFK